MSNKTWSEVGSFVIDSSCDKDSQTVKFYVNAFLKYTEVGEYLQRCNVDIDVFTEINQLTKKQTKVTVLAKMSPEQKTLVDLL